LQKDGETERRQETSTGSSCFHLGSDILRDATRLDVLQYVCKASSTYNIHRQEKVRSSETDKLLGPCGEFGDALCTLGDRMLSKLARQNKSNASLNFAGGDGGFLGIRSKFRCLRGNTFKDIVDK